MVPEMPDILKIAAHRRLDPVGYGAGVPAMDHLGDEPADAAPPRRDHVQGHPLDRCVEACPHGGVGSQCRRQRPQPRGQRLARFAIRPRQIVQRDVAQLVPQSGQPDLDFRPVEQLPLRGFHLGACVGIVLKVARQILDRQFHPDTGNGGRVQQVRQELLRALADLPGDSPIYRLRYPPAAALSDH